MRQKALVDINMILDTRLAVLSRLNTSAANAIVRSDWYRARETDDFASVTDGAISNDEFKKLYESYDVETLVNALMTDFIYFMRKEVEMIVPEMDIKGLNDVLEFDINVYPYQLLPEEKKMIERAVARYLTAPAQVKVVDIAYHLLTPGMLDSNYDMMTLYNYEDWLKFHHGELKRTPIKEFTLFHPRIAPSGVVPETDEWVKDPFMTVPMVLCEYIQLHPIPTMLTCWNPVVYGKLANIQVSPHHE